MMRCRGRIARRSPPTGVSADDDWSSAGTEDAEEPVGSLFEGWFFTALILGQGSFPDVVHPVNHRDPSSSGRIHRRRGRSVR